jgi:hypothetical protein
MKTRSQGQSGRNAVSAAMAIVLFPLSAAVAHSAPTVPWLNQAASIPAVATMSAHAVATRACAAGDVRVAAGAAGAWRGMATQEIRITNNGSEACFLPGFPSAQLQPSVDAPQTVGASDSAPQLAGERIDLAPGEDAVMLIGTPGVCEAANGAGRKVAKRLQLALPGGGVKVLDGVHVDTLCGRATVTHFHRVQADGAGRATTAGSPSGASLAQLTGTLNAPDTAARGGVLGYTVTLTNPTAAPVSLAACPAYTQSLYADGKAVDATLRLNCAGAGAQIPANASVSFAMQAQVPADMAGASLKLSWKLQDGPGVGKLIGLQ